MITKLTTIKTTTIILMACVLSFFIIDFAARDMNGDFRDRLDSHFKDSLEISFDYRTKNDERKAILEYYAKKYHFSFYCYEYHSENDSNFYFIYDPSNRITLKKYDIGGYFNRHYIHDVKAINENQYYLTNYNILFDGDKSAIEDAFSNMKDIRIKEEYNQHNHHVKGNSTFIFLLQTVSTYITILLIVYLIVELAIYEKQCKEYALKKMRGISVLTILKKTYINDFLAVSLLYWLTNLIFVFGLGYKGNDYSYILKMSAKIYGLLLIPFILIDVLESVGVRFLSIKDALKNRVNVVVYDAVSIAFKFVTVFFLTFQLVSLTSHAYDLYTQTRELNKIAQKTKYMMRIYGMDVRYDLSNDETVKVMNKFDQLVQDNGGIYIDASNYYTKDGGNPYGPLSYFKKAIIVNENAVSFFHIKDVKGKDIIIDKVKQRYLHPILLVPEDLKDDPKVQSYIKDSDLKYEVITIQSNQKIYSFRPELANRNDGWIINSIMIIDGSSLNDALIPIKDKDIEMGFKNLLNAYDIDDKLLLKMRPADYFKEHMKWLKEEAMRYLVISIFSLLLAAIVIYQSIVIYFKRNMKRILILKVNGNSFVERYDMYFITDLSLYMIMGILSVILGRPHNVLALFVIYLLNIIFLTATLRHVESSKIIAFLKGDDR